MLFDLQATMETPFMSTEVEILRQFFLDYLNRFEVYKLHFKIDKPRFQISGQTRNTNTIVLDGKTVSMKPLFEQLGIPNHISVGGDFIIGYDFESMEQADDAFKGQLGLSIFDIANHGYEAFLLAGHIRAIILNILDQHIRDFRQIDNNLFGELNELLRGPVSQALVERTNPVRNSLTKGAVGIHGQLHRSAYRFNFVCTGLPVFYYDAAVEQFFYLEPTSGPPLGYFNKADSLFKPYVPHSIKLHPGDYLVLATDGCFDSECTDDEAFPLGIPRKPIRHYTYPINDSLDVMHCFDARLMAQEPLPYQEDPAVQSFCFLLEQHMKHGADADVIVHKTLEALHTNPIFYGDDQSLIVVRIED